MGESAAFERCMTYSEKLARLTYYVFGATLVLALVWGVQRFLSKAPIDPQTGSAGLAVESDAGTGCQYVVTPWGGIVARLDPEGKPLCKAPAR